MRSPPPSSAIRPAWRGTPRRRCRCCRLSRAPTRPPWPACCAGWPSPGRPAPADGDERGGLLSELDEVTRWLAARAADAPDNFLHLLRLLEAERAWAVGDFRAAALAFDAARREAAGRQRPWHRALITERAARFYLAHGIEHAGYDLLAQARQRLPRLGRDREGRPTGLGLPGPAATRRRDRRTRGDQPADPPHRSRHGHHRNARPARHPVRVAGAELGDQHRTAARPRGRGAQRDDRRHRRPPAAVERRPARLAAARTDGGGTVPVSGTGHERAVPMSVLRYAQRTRRTAGRGRRHPRRPLRPRPVLRRPRPAARCWPYPSSAAARCGRCCCWRTASSAARSPPNGSTASSSSPASSPSPSTTPSCTPSSAGSPTSRRRCGGWPRWSPAAAPPDEVFAAVTAEVGAAALRGVHVSSAGTTRTARPRRSLAAGHGPDRAATRARRRGTASRGRNVTTLVFQTGRAGADRPTTARTPATAADCGRLAAGMRSAVGVPISVEGRLWGVMIAGSTLEPLARGHRGSGWPVSPNWSPPPSPTPRARRNSPPRAPGSWPPPTRPAGASSGTCTTAPSSGWSRWRCELQAAQAAVPPELDELGARSSTSPSTRQPARWTSCASSPAASTRRSSPKAACPRRSRRWPDAAPSRSSWTCGSTAAARADRDRRLLPGGRGADQRGQTRRTPRPSTSQVDTTDGDAVLRVCVRDDGRGGADLAGGSGLVGLKDRVEALGGRLVAAHRPRRGHHRAGRAPAGPGPRDLRLTEPTPRPSRTSGDGGRAPRE